MMLFKTMLLLRPYSFVGIILVGIIAYVLSNKSFFLQQSMILSIIVPLLFWMKSIFIGEYFHRIENKTKRIKPPSIAFILVVLLLVITCFLIFPPAILIVCLMLIAAGVYSIKNQINIFGRISFLTRGFLEAGVLVFLLIIYGQSFSIVLEHSKVILWVYVITVSRNLIGDVRDIKFDKYTFAKVFGKNTALGVSMFLMALAILLAENLWVAFPLLIMFILTVLNVNAYILHKTYVISTVASYALYINAWLNQEPFLLISLYLGSVLLITYDLVPRKTNAEYIKIMRDACD